MAVEDPVQLFGLRTGAREPVEDEAVGRSVVNVELFFDHADDDVIRDQEPAIHEPFGFEAEFGPRARGLAEQVARRQMVDAVVLGEADRLRPLASTLLPEQHQPGATRLRTELRQGSLRSCASSAGCRSASSFRARRRR